MPKTKQQPQIDEDDLFVPEIIAEPVRQVNTGMILDMDGHGGEVASALIVNGLRAYLSVVNKGVSLIAANRSHTLFVPVKIAACEEDLDVKRDDAKPLVESQGVLAFLLDDEDRVSYYLPVAEYLARAENHGESGLRLDVDEHADWLDQYEGHKGIRQAFSRLLAL